MEDERLPRLNDVLEPMEEYGRHEDEQGRLVPGRVQAVGEAGGRRWPGGNTVYADCIGHVVLLATSKWVVVEERRDLCARGQANCQGRLPGSGGTVFNEEGTLTCRPRRLKRAPTAHTFERSGYASDQRQPDHPIPQRSECIMSVDASITLPDREVDKASWPALTLRDWQDTYETLHMWTQIVGKTRLAHVPMQNHWWQATLYLTPRGLTTSAMPIGSRCLAVDFDFLDHQVYLRSDDGATRAVPLVPRTVADFYGAFEAALGILGFASGIRPVPVEVQVAIPFAEDHQHKSYDADAARRWWQAMLQAHRVLEQFRARFIGKASPVHFFWGSFDLATTRFSGRRAPRHPGGAPNCPDYVMVEAYSHECSSCGLWPGGGAVSDAAFYAYAYPEPPGYADHPVQPAAAYYDRDMREFILPYEAVRRAASPDEALLAFAQTTYEAAADLASWDRSALERPPTATRHVR